MRTSNHGGMQQGEDEQSGLPPPPFSYRLVRRFYRFLTNVWFREITVVDQENIPEEGGVLYITWHPSGLIDPMLMTSIVDEQLTTVGKHTLFRTPLLGRLLKASGVVPIERLQDVDDSKASRERNQLQLRTLSSTLAAGGNVLIFPEGETHADSSVRRVRSGAAWVLLDAIREADNRGLPRPKVVPVGLHYSESQRFRERAAVVMERVMEVPPVPQGGNESPERHQHDRTWVSEVTERFEVELQRANHSKTTWAERTMIWRGRSLVYAEKQRQTGEELKKPSYAASVLAARRLRAGWEFMGKHEPASTSALAKRCESHFGILEQRGITPYDVDARPERLSFLTYVKHFGHWIWALVWMFGLVTWSAIAGNYVPYKANGFLSRALKRRAIDASVIGTVKVLSAVVMFPVWWVVASAIITWSLLSAASPVNGLLLSHWLLLEITKFPGFGVFLLFMIWWPVSARLHLKLYARLVTSYQNLNRWEIWKDDSKDWALLVEEQRRLSAELVALGSGLVLPGDPDWKDPPAGHDDAASVRFRQPQTVS